MNYYNYFTEIEDRFQQRRGALLMLSTLDWALIETWREAGIPLECVLRGIDDAFDKHDAKLLRGGARRPRKVNGLAWCAQAVMEAVEKSREAAIGINPQTAVAAAQDSGFEPARVARYLLYNAARLHRAALRMPDPSRTAAGETADRLRGLASTLEPDNSNLDTGNLETLDRTLTVLEEKLFAALITATPEDQLAQLRAQADRELAPYRGRMGAVQIKQVQQQFLQKRLLEAHALPRLSLFYMPHEDSDDSVDANA